MYYLYNDLLCMLFFDYIGRRNKEVGKKNEKERKIKRKKEKKDKTGKKRK